MAEQAKLKEWRFFPLPCFANHTPSTINCAWRYLWGVKLLLDKCEYNNIIPPQLILLQAHKRNRHRPLSFCKLDAMAGGSGTSFVPRCLFILAYVAYVTCAFSNRLRHHRLSIIARTTNINAQHAHLQPPTGSFTRVLAATSTIDTNLETGKSAESTFWLAVPTTSASNNRTSKLPAFAGLDRETGPLPPGAYKQIGEKDSISSCLLAIGIQSQANSDDGNEVWEEASKNCQKLVDSGFNTFIMNNPAADDLKSATKVSNKKKRIQRGRTEKSMIALEKQRQQNRILRTKIRHETEENFYKVLHQNTPMSVLRYCNFMVNLEVPAILSTEQHKYSGLDEEQSTVPFGNGWMVRESVGNALKRVKGECLGSVVLECKSATICCILQQRINLSKHSSYSLRLRTLSISP